MTDVAGRPGLAQIRQAPMWAKTTLLLLVLLLAVLVVVKVHSSHEPKVLFNDPLAAQTAEQACHFPPAAINDGGIYMRNVSDTASLYFVPYTSPSGQHEARVLLTDGDHTQSAEMQTCG